MSTRSSRSCSLSSFGCKYISHRASSRHMSRIIIPEDILHVCTRCSVFHSHTYIIKGYEQSHSYKSGLGSHIALLECILVVQDTWSKRCRVAPSKQRQTLDGDKKYIYTHRSSINTYVSSPRAESWSLCSPYWCWQRWLRPQSRRMGRRPHTSGSIAAPWAGTVVPVVGGFTAVGTEFDCWAESPMAWLAVDGKVACAVDDAISQEDQNSASYIVIDKDASNWDRWQLIDVSSSIGYRDCGLACRKGNRFEERGRRWTEKRAFPAPSGLCGHGPQGSRFTAHDVVVACHAGVENAISRPANKDSRRHAEKLLRLITPVTLFAVHHRPQPLGDSPAYWMHIAEPGTTLS